MKDKRKIAVIGYACKYPDADDVQQFWQNILARRRAFRDMPSKRLNKSYFSTDRTLPDHIYTNKVAVLKNYYFDRAKFKISNSNFQAADLTHWLALDVAAEAIKNASIEQLPKKVKEQTGVIVGNTLTGEFSRANLLRLRWPYVRDCAVKVLREQKRDDEQIIDFITNMEEEYKNSFSAMEEDSLAGGLSNTIAGRICNYYDFNGGGYTIDGACSSSLLAVCKACDSILTGDLLLAIVGGVDLSLDPFELVGFSRAGALATTEMLVYDNNSNGFWPGEGCGFAIFADYEFARELNLTIHATINGWGISSDGKGGLTRPSVEGQLLALQRAYKRAGYGIDTVSYLEGHGTGTKVGDATELTAIIKALENAPPNHPVHIGSVKANIGHTKAASGIAGLIKCLEVLKNRLIPAASGVREPNTLFNQTNHLKLPLRLISYDRDQPMRAGVSSMGFGGINTHITLEEHGSPFQNKDKTKAKRLSASHQDAELFLLAERNSHLVKIKLNILYEKAKLVSIAELTDLSCTIFEHLQNFPCRLAIEAATPEQLAYKISKVIAHIDVSNEGIYDTENGIYFCTSKMPLKIGFLFPGQGNEALSSYGLLQERFPFLSSLLPEYLKNNTGSKSVLDTGFSQPSIVSTSVTAVKFLEQLGVRARIALGHSLGELSALYWAKALTENAVIELSKERGRLMHTSNAVKGQMLSVSMNYKDALIDKFVTEFDVSLACVNGATQIVFSGSKDNINALYVECKSRKIPATLLPVENAFHSKLMKDVEEPFSRFLSSVPLSAPTKKVYSTVSRTLIKDEKEIYSNLINQLTHPVLFYESFERVCQEADLWIEVGPGNTLEKLANSISGVKCISLDFTGKSIRGILKVAGAMFVSDNPVNLEMLFKNRYYRTLLPEEDMTFLEGPCEKVPPVDETVKQTLFKSKLQAVEFIAEVAGEEDLEALFRAALAKELDLPAELVFPHTRMLDDLHLNSLFIGQLLVDFAKKHNLNLTDTPSEYANASVDEIIQMFTMLRKDPSNEGQKIKEEKNNIEGVDSWVFPFEINFKEALLQKKTNEFLSKPSSNFTIGNVPDHLSGIENREFIKAAKILFVFLYAENEVEILNIFDTFLKLYKSQQGITHTVFIQQDPVSGAFAKSLYLEDQHSKVRVVELPAGELTDAILFSELSQPDGFIYARYESGIRYIPQLSAIVDSQPFKSILPNNEDTILVTGGAKGITFECVCELAIKSRCKLVLLGRSDPGNDVQIKQNLARSKNQGIDVKYYTADVEDRQQLRKVIENIYLENTRITGIIHGAGINKPTRITELKFDQLKALLGVKVYGLRNIFQEINTEDLKFCFTFGSIIAECGMEGNADYALANEWLRNEVASLSKRLPGIYFVNMAWSVWGGTGMGENLGVLERLKKRGIKPITLDSGINHFMRLFNYPVRNSNVIITGRHGEISTLRNTLPEVLPIYRFVENIQVFYPNVELIADCTISGHTDLYLRDHMPGGKMILPGTFGLEAMAQAVAVLTGKTPTAITFESVHFIEPVVVENKGKTIRIIVQRLNSNSYLAVLRQESTAFKKDHFRAHIITEEKREPEIAATFSERTSETAPSLGKDDLYGSLLFHKGVFRKISCYRHLDPYACEAYAESATEEKYFSDFLPNNFILNNPCLNDAALHAVQACIPNYTLLPISIEKVCFALKYDYNAVIIKARETDHIDDVYVYDIIMEDSSQNVISLWEGVKFRVLQEKVIRTLSPFFVQLVLQRKINILLGGKDKGHCYFYGEDETPELMKRGDGKPLLPSRLHLTKSHNRDQTLLVESESEIAVDIETIEQKPAEQWQLLLGKQRAELTELICKRLQEDYSSAATRVWCAGECLRKAGAQPNNPLVLSHYDNDGTAYLTSGTCVIMTYKCILKKYDHPRIYSLLLKNTRFEEI